MAVRIEQHVRLLFTLMRNSRCVYGWKSSLTDERDWASVGSRGSLAAREEECQGTGKKNAGLTGAPR